MTPHQRYGIGGAAPSRGIERNEIDVVTAQRLAHQKWRRRRRQSAAKWRGRSRGGGERK